MAEGIFVSSALIAHQRTIPATLAPSTVLQTTDFQRLHWISPVGEDDVLRRLATTSIPFRLGGKCTYVVVGDARVSSTSVQLTRKLVLKWSWPRGSLAQSEPKMLQALGDTAWEPATRRLPELVMAGPISAHEGLIEEAIAENVALQASLRRPEVLVVLRQFQECSRWIEQVAQPESVARDHLLDATAHESARNSSVDLVAVIAELLTVRIPPAHHFQKVKPSFSRHCSRGRTLRSHNRRISESDLHNIRPIKRIDKVASETFHPIEVSGGVFQLANGLIMRDSICRIRDLSVNSSMTF